MSIVFSSHDGAVGSAASSTPDGRHGPV